MAQIIALCARSERRSEQLIAVLTIIIWSVKILPASSFFFPREPNALKLDMKPAYEGDAWMSTRRHLDGTKLILEVNSRIRLKCTIVNNTEDSGCTSSHIYFTRLNKRVVSRFIDLVSSDTALMDIPAVGTNETGNFYCRFKPCGDRNKTNGTFQVSIGTLPQEPYLIRCVIENWNAMNCTWGPSQRKQHNDTNIGLTHSVLQWRRSDSQESPWHRCEDKIHESHNDLPETCKIDLKNSTLQSLFKESIVVKAEAGNALGIVESSQETIDLKQRVIPSPVTGVSFDNEKNELSWLSPVPEHYKVIVPTVRPLYTITGNYTARINSSSPPVITKQITKIVTSNVELGFEARPYSGYHLSVVCQVTPEGSPSQAVHYQFITSPDVPSHNPVLARALFQIVVTDNDLSRSVVLYFKPLMPDYYNGEGLYYVVQARPASDQVSHPNVTRKVVPPASYAELDLSAAMPYSMTVVACNEIGCADKDHLLPVYIPEADQVIATVEDLVVEGNESTVLLHWDNITGAKLFTVYWCDYHSHEQICKGKMDWKDVPADTNEVVLDLKGNYENFMFGISVSNPHNISSVGKMAKCNYYIEGVPDPPSDLRVSFTNLKYGDVYLSWSVEPCVRRAKKGYIKNFIVTYCLVDTAESEECTGEEIKTLVSNTQTDTTLDGLDQGSYYKFGIQSQSRKNLSLPSLQVIEHISQDWKTTQALVLIGLAGIFCCLLAVIGALVACRSCNLGWKKFASGLQITIPEPTRLPLPSTASDTPFLMSFPNTPSPTSATPSLDSGRFSYTREEDSSTMAPYSNLASKNHLFGDFNHSGQSGHSGVSSPPHLVSIQEHSDSETDDVFEEQKSNFLQTYTLPPQPENPIAGQTSIETTDDSGKVPCNTYMQVLPNESDREAHADKDSNPMNPFIPKDQLMLDPYLAKPATSGSQYIDPNKLLTSAKKPDCVDTAKAFTASNPYTSKSQNLATDYVPYSNYNPNAALGGDNSFETDYCQMSGSGQSDTNTPVSDYVRPTDLDSDLSLQAPSSGYVDHDLLGSDMCHTGDIQPSHITPNTSPPKNCLAPFSQKETPPTVVAEDPGYLPCPPSNGSCLPNLAMPLTPSGYVQPPTVVLPNREAMNPQLANNHMPKALSSGGYIPLPLITQLPNKITTCNICTDDPCCSEQDEVLLDLTDPTSKCENNNQPNSDYIQQSGLQNDGYVQHPNTWTSAF